MSTEVIAAPRHDVLEPVGGRSRHGRSVLLATIAFLCCGLTWIVALAPFTGIDEFDHAFRADSVAQGHWQPGSDPLPSRLGRGDLIPVHADLASSAATACLNLPYPGTYNCSPYAAEPGGNVLIASAAARYDPVYYLIAGTLAKPFHGDAELYAMRVASLAICAALFAIALWSLLLVSGTRWPIVALLAGILPTTVYSVALAAPNGTQMMAGLAVWAGGIALVRRELRPRLLYPATAVAMALLVTTHTLGCLWLGLIGVGLALYAGLRRTLLALRPRSAGECFWFALMLLSIVFEVVWVLLARTNNPGDGTPPVDPHLWPDLPNHLVLWPLQAIAAYPMRNQPAPTGVYALALAIIVGLAALALRHVYRHPSMRRTFVFLAAITVLVPVVATVATYRTAGFAWQGRYGMPFSVGLFVIAALALDRRPDLHRRRLPLATVPVLWTLAQILGARHIGDKQRGHDYFSSPNSWHAPPLAVVDLLGVVALVVACWLSWRLVRDTPSPARTWS